MDAIASGRRAHHQHGIAHARRLRRNQLVALDQPDAHRIHQRIAAVALVEVDFAADRRDAEAVAIAADAADDAVEEVAIARAAERTKAQRIEQGDWTRAHREDVAHDAANASGRALIGFDGAGVIVALDLEDDRLPVADVHRARILLADLEQHALAGGGKALEQRAAVFIAAVLAPHRAKEA